MASRRLLFQVRRDFGKLLQCGFQVFDNLGGDDIGIRTVRTVFE